MKSKICFYLFLLLIVACGSEIKSPSFKTITCTYYQAEDTAPIDTTLTPKLAYFESYYPNGFKKERITSKDTVEYCYLDSLLFLENYHYKYLLSYYIENKLDLQAVFYKSNNPTDVKSYVYFDKGVMRYTYMDYEETLYNETLTTYSFEGDDSVSIVRNRYFREGKVYSTDRVLTTFTKLGKEFKVKEWTSESIYDGQESSYDQNYSASYDKNGRLVSFGDTTFTYKDHLKYVEYNDKTKIYDDKGNILNEDNKQYVYVYDQYNNWIRKDIFEDGKLIRVEKREIEYYTEKQDFTLKQADRDLVDSLYERAKEYVTLCDLNMRKFDAYYKAMENGEYDEDFTITEAASIDEFTPRLWSILSKMKIDYNRDGVEDYVIAYDTPVQAEDEGYQRVLAMFEKNSDNKWVLIQYFTNVIPTKDSKWGMVPPTLNGVYLEDSCLVVSDALELGRGWSKERYYKYLMEDEYGVPSSDWYLVKEDYSSHDGPEAFYHTVTDYLKGTKESVSEYEYEDPNDSPIGKNGTEEKKETITTIPPKMGTDDLD